MKESFNDRFPPYVPAAYRFFTWIRKARRQAQVRQFEKMARVQGGFGVVADGPFKPLSSAQSDQNHFINKNALSSLERDLALKEIVAINQAVEALKNDLKKRGLFFTNTAATFLERMFYPRSEQTKSWENAWTIYHSGVRKGERVLDIGGASTPFSFYLASMGCDVSILDNDWNNCGTLYNADYVARKMGWRLKADDRDIDQPFPYKDNAFDRVFSICTIEHLISPVRQKMMQEVGRVLKPGGIAGITFCYDLNHVPLTVDKGLRFGFREKFHADVIRPSGLEVFGNTDLPDDSPDTPFLGSIFLRKKS